MGALVPPSESKIAIGTDRSGFPVITLPASRSSKPRLVMLIILLAWLTLWGLGWFTAFRSIRQAPNGIDSFISAWLAMWTVGGIFALSLLWRLIRPTIPESLALRTPELVYDSGVQSVPSFAGCQVQQDYMRRFYQRRKQIEFTPQEVNTLALRETNDGNRLTIDHANDRIDLGAGLTEVEREWLFNVIKTEYRL